MDWTTMRSGAVARRCAGGALVLCAAAAVAIALTGGDEVSADADESPVRDPAAAAPGGMPAHPPRAEAGAWPSVAEKRRPSVDAELGPPVLEPPVLGVRLRWIRDNFGERRGRRRHGGVDIFAAHGTPVLAAVDGWIWRMTWDEKGGRMLYILEASGLYLLAYAHLDAYVSGLAVGRPIRRGEVVGYVGRTGNAAGSPHLHLAVTRIRSPERWWDGVAVDPYPLLVEGLAP